MSITVGTDTYITLASADTYIENNYTSISTEYSSWISLSDNDKEIYLRNATKRIDRQILQGIKAVDTQTLQFPRALRTDAYRNDYTDVAAIRNYDWYVESEVQQRVKDAQVEEALGLVVEGSNYNERMKLQQQGVKSFRLDDLSENYGNGVSSGFNNTNLISVTAKELLKTYLAGSVRVSC